MNKTEINYDDAGIEVLHALNYCPEKCTDFIDATGAVCGCAANINAAIARAVAAEREACAAVADFYGELTSDTPRRIAAAIRARSKEVSK